jgi:hypothetical protein
MLESKPSDFFQKARTMEYEHGLDVLKELINQINRPTSDVHDP